MLVYQNKNHDICITSGNLPVENPEYVIKMVNGMLVCTGDDAGDAANLIAAEERVVEAEKRATTAEAIIVELNTKIEKLEAQLSDLTKNDESDTE